LLYIHNKTNKISTAIACYINYALKHLIKGKYEPVPISNKKIAELFNISERYAHKILKKLVSLNYISCKEIGEFPEEIKKIYKQKVDSSSLVYYRSEYLQEIEKHIFKSKSQKILETLQCKGEFLLKYNELFDYIYLNLINVYGSDLFILDKDFKRVFNISLKNMMRFKKEYVESSFKIVNIKNSFTQHPILEEYKDFSHFKIRTKNKLKLTKEGMDQLVSLNRYATFLTNKRAIIQRKSQLLDLKSDPDKFFRLGAAFSENEISKKAMSLLLTKDFFVIQRKQQQLTSNCNSYIKYFENPKIYSGNLRHLKFLA